MGRKRVIDQQQVLDAAQAVVARDGAARLTLDAVAAEAGISKGAVVYDYGSKQGLIQAMVNRAVEADNAFNRAAAEPFKDSGSPVIRGRIAAAAQPFPEAFRPVAHNICVALAEDAQLRKAIQANQSAVIADIAQTSSQPRGALLAYLALEGLKLLETLDYHQWPDEERSRILQEIGWLVDQRPG
ncbi:TetR/AcrR family transcriptional regulator [Bosea sp. UC22_33]|uniref:TetR/AcrR family transcriptional regulator n=1 Tax=Bosea sp. UC22_33 TaxID=3350165 RepID=UPI00366E22B2